MTASPGGTWRIVSAASRKITAGPAPTGEYRSWVRYTAGPASISRACATRSTCGAPEAVKYHRPKRRKISAPAEVVPRWRAGIEAVVATPKVRDAFWFGLYTGMRLNEVLSLQWERVDMAGLVFRVDETKTGEPLELPITRQLAAILERRNRESETLPGDLRGWVFPSSAKSRPHL